MHHSWLRSGHIFVFLLGLVLAAPAGASVTLTPTTLTFGKHVLGTTTASKTVTLYNGQTTALTITSIAVGGSFAHTGGNCPSSPAQLGPGGSCSILIDFTATVLGSQSGRLTVTDSAGNSPQITTLAGTGIAPVTVSPTSLTFPGVPVGQSSTAQTVTLTNQQNVALTFNNVFASGNFAVATNTCGVTLAALGTCTVGITFSPTATGTRTGTLSFSDSALNTPQTVGLTGTGLAAALLSIAVTPANPTILIGGAQQFTATGTYSDNTTKDLSASATWTTAQSSVASISTSGLATGLAAGSTTIAAALAGVSGSTLLTVNQVFFPTGSLNTARYYHTATLLDTGMVLIAGGIGPVPGGTGALGELASSEIYNPGTGAFTHTSKLATARGEHTATLLNNGTVLIAGGAGSSGALASAEIYNPTTATFYPANNNMQTARYGHTATLLPNGMVLIAGGYSGTSVLASAEIYSPLNGTFAPTGRPKAARFGATATLLPDGLVLIAGGSNANGALASAELFDPISGTFAFTGNLNVARSNATATLLNNGLILIANGYDNSVTGPHTSAELYDPAAGTFRLTGSQTSSAWLGTATLLNNGSVLMAGSAFNSAHAEIYNPFAGTFLVTGALITPRDLQTATMLADGSVLIAAGHSNATNTVLATAERYEPTTLTPGGLVSISITPSGPGVTVGASRQLTAIGTFTDNSTQQLASVSWISSNPAAALISDDVTNSGRVYGVAAGSTVISACAGSLCGTTPLTVTSAPIP